MNSCNCYGNSYLFARNSSFAFWNFLEFFFPSNTFYLRLVAEPTDRESESVSYSVVSDSLRPQGLEPARLLCPWNSLDKNTWVVSHSLFQGIFLTQGQNLDLLHCRQILHRLSQQGNPHRYRGLTIYCNHFLALQVIFFSFLINFIGVYSWFTVYLTISCWKQIITADCEKYKVLLHTSKFPMFFFFFLWIVNMQWILVLILIFRFLILVLF